MKPQRHAALSAAFFAEYVFMYVVMFELTIK